MKNEILFKPNGLIMATAEQSLTSSQYKLYDTLLQRGQVSKDYSYRNAVITREEIKGVIKSNDKATLEDIKSTFESFMNVNIRFKLGTKHVGATLLSAYVYDEVNDSFTCSIHEYVFEALMEYSQLGYSPIDLKLVRQARGYYTQKIYGLLRMWSRYRECITKSYNITQIKDVCDVKEGTSYDVYGNFKKKIINPAVKEINEKLNMEVTYKEIKCGRKVQSIEFTFIDHEPRKYKFDDKKIIEPNEIIEEIKVEEKNDTIDSIDYMNMIDCNINESIHNKFISDFEDYKSYFVAVKTAAEKTLGAIGGKTINKRNYKYFKTCLENLI